MDPEKKAKLLERLKEGRARVKAAREEAKAKGLPDPKPRKARAKKQKTPIDSAPNDAVNAVAATPVDPSVSKSTPIDVPNLPGEGKEVASKKDIVPDAEKVPEAPPKKGIASTGRPKTVDANDMLVNQETGSQVISAQFPGQKESIKKVLKESVKPETPAKVSEPPSKTVKKVKSHVPDVKAVEARAPFSYSAIRKLLYQ